jgi:hypothetical protein
MSWVSRIVEELSESSCAGDLLLLSRLQDRLGGAELPDGVDDIWTLLRRYRSKGLPSGSELQAVLAVLEVSEAELERLVEFQRALDHKLGQGPMRLLTQTLHDVVVADAPALRVPISAPLAIPVPDLQGFNLLLGAQAEATLLVDASPELGPELPAFAMDRKPVMVEFSGTLKGEAKGSLPLNPITLSGNAAGGIDVDLCYWFLNRGERRWGRVLVDNAMRLGDALPLDLDRIHDLLDGQELLAMRFKAEGKLKLGGEVKVSLPVELLVDADAVMGAGVGFSAVRSGLHSFYVRADASRPGNVLLSLMSGGTESTSVARRLGVQIDFADLYAAIKPQLQQHLGSASTIIDELMPFTEPSRLIRERASAWLRDRESEVWFREITLATLGVDPSRAPADVVADLISRRIETTALKWQVKAEALVVPVTEGVLTDLGLAGDLRPRVEELVQEAVAEFFAEAEEAIAGYVKSNAKYKKVVKALDDIGERANGRLKSVDARAKALRRLLGRFQEKVGEISRRIEEAAEAKLSARMTSESSESGGRGSELELSFRPGDEAARAAWRQALSGDVHAVVNRWGGEPDGPVQIVGGTLSTFVRQTRRRGFEIVLLDFQLSGRSILDISVRVEADARGNVLAVVSRASVEEERAFLAERRSLRFVESSRLALASLTSDLDLDLTLSHGGKRLDPKEARSVLNCFVDRDLLNPASAAFAADYLRAYPQQAKEAELMIRMRLTSHELDRLLGVGISPSTLADQARAVAAEEVGWAIGRYGTHNPRALLAFFVSCGLPGNWAQIIRSRQKSDLTALSAGINEQADVPSGFNTQYDFQNAIAHAAAMIDLRDHMAGLLLTMQEVRGLAANAPDWGRSRWQDELNARQRIIAGHIDPWVSVNLYRMIRGQARPLTIALFRSVLRLAGRVPETGANLVFAEIKLPGKSPKSLTGS